MTIQLSPKMLKSLKKSFALTHSFKDVRAEKVRRNCVIFASSTICLKYFVSANAGQDALSCKNQMFSGPIYHLLSVTTGDSTGHLPREHE